MKYIRIARKALNAVNSIKNKNANKKETSEEAVNNDEFKFPPWLFGGIFGFFGIVFLAGFVIIIAALIVLEIIEIDSGVGNGGIASNGCSNLPAIDTICKSVTVEGVGTMSIDEYVAGVVAAEVGGMPDENYNTYKAVAIAARSYGIAKSKKDSNGNCVIVSSESVQAYKDTTDENIINAANETSGMVLVKDDAVFLSEYDALCIESEDSDNYYLCQGGIEEEHLAVPRSWLESMKGSAYIAATRGWSHGRGMSQNGAWYLAREKKWDYEKILDYFYGDDGVVLSSFYNDFCSSGISEDSDGSNSGDNSGSSSNGTANSCGAGVIYESQPDPAIALNYWDSRGMINADDFIYPTDSSTGYSLGAHPKNAVYKNLTSYKLYNNIFIWPVTPVDGVYTEVYTHVGIDIMAQFGSPVYSPVDGDMQYSEWGHTVNEGCDETAYTVSIKFPTTTVNGDVISTAYLTHMSGIIYYCPRETCNRKVKKGELLGFVGNASGSATVVGWASHLHLTFYDNVYESGLLTPKVEKLYNISSGVSRKAGE